MKKFIYLISSEEKNKYKIGVSLNPTKRIKQLQTGCGEKLTLINTYECNYPYKVEKALHFTYEYLKSQGEWYKLTLEDEINFIKNCEKCEKNILILKKSGNEFI